MKIYVCIKQVPDTTKVDIDPETMTLKRSGIDSKVNPFDLYAIETAVKLKEKHQANVCAISMGPQQTEAAIRESYMLGVDEGVLLSDRNFAGADVLATAYALSQGILSLGIPDVIICGQQTTDGDTAQVGPEIAEFLDIPHVAWVRRIVDSDEKGITVEMDMPDTIEVVRISYPCLITVEKGVFQPRLPSFKLKMSTRERPIRRLTLADLPDSEPLRYGLKGSPTQVIRVFPPQNSSHRETWDDSPEVLSDKLYARLNELKFL